MKPGAGKSILLDSLGFVLGWRGRAELVRKGAAQGEVQAWFDLDKSHPARAVLDEAGIPVEDELILRRVNTVDGRKTAWINDRRCSGEVLRQVSATLIELHGQHDDRGLLDRRGHRDLLDVFGGLSEQRQQVRANWRAMRAARLALEQAEASLAALQAEEDFLRHAASELEELDPQTGEEETLDARRRLMQGAERIRADIQNAQAGIGAEGAEGAAAGALRWLEGVADKAEGALEAPMAALSRALVELDEAGAGVARCLETLSFNPADLEETEERLFAIRALARKHGVGADELPGLTGTFRTRLMALDQGGTEVQSCTQALDQARMAYDRSATALSTARGQQALRLDQAVMAELPPLKMERAVFQTDVTPADPGPDGQDDVGFTVAPNPGAPAGAISKIASGGELSRFLLALKLCLSRETGPQRTMIFDEIDRGVGGATADAVGRRLARLAQAGQVLVVTHSPQVAALASHHWRVEKHVTGDQTLSGVAALTGQSRIDEIARMLSGDTITIEARAAAQALVDGYVT